MYRTEIGNSFLRYGWHAILNPIGLNLYTSVSIAVRHQVENSRFLFYNAKKQATFRPVAVK